MAQTYTHPPRTAVSSDTCTVVCVHHPLNFVASMFNAHTHPQTAHVCTQPGTHKAARGSVFRTW